MTRIDPKRLEWMRSHGLEERFDVGQWDEKKSAKADPYLRCTQCGQRSTAEMDDKRHCELLDRLNSRIAQLEKEREAMERVVEAARHLSNTCRARGITVEQVWEGGMASAASTEVARISLLDTVDQALAALDEIRREGK
jgi:outer membrane murein-binding lipoprotein Lpp